MSKKEIPEIIGKKMYIGFLFTFIEKRILVGHLFATPAQFYTLLVNFVE